MPSDTAERRQNPTLSHVAESHQPDLLFHTLLAISPPVQRAMRSPVELPKLTEFINKASFYTDNSPVLYVGDLMPPKGEDATIDQLMDTIEGVECCAVQLGPFVTVRLISVSRWPNYFICCVSSLDAVLPVRLHLVKVV